jgi:hypothetical protein
VSQTSRCSICHEPTRGELPVCAAYRPPTSSPDAPSALAQLLDRHRDQLPRHLLWRFRHRPWVCYCGRAFVIRRKLGGDGGLADWVVNYWEEWPQEVETP